MLRSPFTRAAGSARRAASPAGPRSVMPMLSAKARPASSAEGRRGPLSDRGRVAAERSDVPLHPLERS
jgi:hypothetical protein